MTRKEALKVTETLQSTFIKVIFKVGKVINYELFSQVYVSYSGDRSVRLKQIPINVLLLKVCFTCA